MQNFRQSFTLKFIFLSIFYLILHKIRGPGCEIICVERKGKLTLVREEVVRESHRSTQASNSCAVLCCNKTVRMGHG